MLVKIEIIDTRNDEEICKSFGINTTVLLEERIILVDAINNALIKHNIRFGIRHKDNGSLILEYIGTDSMPDMRYKLVVSEFESDNYHCLNCGAEVDQESLECDGDVIGDCPICERSVICFPKSELLEMDRMSPEGKTLGKLIEEKPVENNKEPIMNEKELKAIVDKEAELSELQEFRESKLLWYVNQMLHLFGWALKVEIENGKPVRMFPTKFASRGFSEEINTSGYEKLGKYLARTLPEANRQAFSEAKETK